MQKEKNQQAKTPTGQNNGQTPYNIVDYSNMETTAQDCVFVNAFVRTGNAIAAVKLMISEGTFVPKGKCYDYIRKVSEQFMNRVGVQKEMLRLMEEIKNENIATADEVMQYFTSVMRGEVKDQFGLEATLSDRTKAAQELARRTVDVEARKNGEPDQLVAIKLDWQREQ